MTQRPQASAPRRSLVAVCSIALGAVLLVSSPWAAAQPASAGPPDPKLIEDLVVANRILADQHVLEGWGHISVRHNRDPNRYLMSRAQAPELVAAVDIVEFDLDSQPVKGVAAIPFYSERFIHGEIYKLRPDVMAIVHTHALPLIPFGVTYVPLRPVYHRAAFVAEGVPVFEIRDAGGMTDMLIRDGALGRALAHTLRAHPAALMRGHGAVVVGPSVRRVVTRAIFLTLNATAQAQAMMLGGPINYIQPEEARLIEKRESEERAGFGAGRAWEAWKKKAMAK